ncbi:MAG: hypothetical protein ACYCT7_03590 [bacterium]
MKSISVRSDSKINYMAKIIAQEFLHRGTSTTEKLAATMRFAKEMTGLRNLCKLEKTDIDKIINNLQEKFQSGQLSTSSVNSHISSLNNIIKYIGKTELYIKASDYSLSRKFNDSKNKENSREASSQYKNWLNGKYEQTGKIGYKSLCHAVNIQSANLRLRESLTVKLLEKDFGKNILSLTDKKGAHWDGTKNTRPREIKLNAEQKTALIEARQFLKENGLNNLNTLSTLKQGKEFAQNALKNFKKETSVYFHYHGERHYRAHEAYKKGWEAKGYKDIECRARLEIDNKKLWMTAMVEKIGLSVQEFRTIDREIRQEISNSLGHERIEITNRYLG